MKALAVRLLFSIFLLTLLACAPQSASEESAVQNVSEDNFARQRRRLVEQLKAEGIKSQGVLDALLKVPRHKFVPSSSRHFSYENRPLPIGQSQTISQPFIVGYMTEAAEIAPGEKVLEIGTGSGYQAAVLAELAKQVYTIEIIPELAEGARTVLRELGYKNVEVRTGNGYAGWPEHAPFDAIVVTAAPDEVPKALVEQLAVRGKMVVPVGSGFQQMVIINRTESGVVERRTIPVAFVPMTGKPSP
jgi:protein-L-isoaspartate(D-aspartate) O-methyltransferase